jgi:hypothetical protein
MTAPTTNPFGPHPQEAQFGLRVAGLLSTSSQRLAPDIGERLRFAREQALSRAKFANEPRVAAVPVGAQGVVHAGQGSLGLSSPPAWWLRVLGFLPLVLLLVGLGLVQQASQREQLRAVADVDTVLLADQLPPRAYSDPGFAEYLRSPPP